MTSIVGIRCTDGVVIGADSSATLGNLASKRTIEQLTDHKITIFDDKIILAGSGQFGIGQRFRSVVGDLSEQNQFEGKSELEIAKLLSQKGIEDFKQTHLEKIGYTAFVAYVGDEQPCLCEFPGGDYNFQPEIKQLHELWFTSAGSGQPITDTLLALFREIFWPKEPPNVQGGIFVALWALRHACEVNTGGIKEPVHLAVLARENGVFRARKLDRDEIAEHDNMVSAATDHLRDFRNILEGKLDPSRIPVPRSV